VVGLVLGQWIDKKSHVIYYASYTLKEKQVIYNINKKKFLAVVFGFEKFRPCLIGSHVIVLIDYATLNHLIKEKYAQPRLIRWIMQIQKF